MNKFLHFVRNLKLGSTFGMLILVVMWPTPTLGLLITSLRPSSLAETSPWWEALFNPLSTIWTIAAYQNSLSSGMLDSLINTIAVTIPATILPLMIAANAAYAFTFLNFKGKEIYFAILVALMVIPLQSSLIPVLRGMVAFQKAFHIPLTGTYASAWVVHSAFAMPLAIYILRNYDELTLEMVTEAERQFIWQEYAPEPNMILNLGIRRRLAPILNNDRRKIELLHSLLFTLPGSPILYYGDEIGMGDNLNLPDRYGVRTPMQWDASPHGGFTSATPFTEMVTGEYGSQKVNVADQLKSPDSLLRILQKMIALRKQQAALSGSQLEWLETGNRAVLAYVRAQAGEALLILNNLSPVSQFVQFPVPFPKTGRELFSDQALSLQPRLELLPYAYLWI